ncbi:RNA methyltransferase substrate-binding domain-containing protein [Cesiribacter andamanensis]|uniref:RNA 2'-O ribose methyltransferase substrate binding protein n=1 Tax=Cesiribacter andamanensis AMV16 TaxID=1279009 RepID=M7NRH3_9BACT|nr:RNA 2'-O ribose methyltransferase substrate binding protein [Cesiribacter andamanensis AMV16]
MEKRPKFTIDRRKEGEPDLIFGTRAVLEALHAGREIEDLLIQRDLNNDLIRELKAAAAAIDLPYQKVPAEKLNRITKKIIRGWSVSSPPSAMRQCRRFWPPPSSRARCPCWWCWTALPMYETLAP